MKLHLMKEVCAKLLRSYFPPVEFAFAYGSAVFKQHSRTKVQILLLVNDRVVKKHNIMVLDIGYA